MSCGDCITSTLTKCCSCWKPGKTSETDESANKHRTEKQVVRTEPQTQNKAHVSDESSGRSRDADVSSDPEDPEKYRYSGRNFDVINLDETPHESTGGETKKVVVTKLETSNKKSRSALYKFTSTRRGGKNDSVYTKTTQF